MLNEGIIQVPADFQEMIFKEILKYISTSSLAKSDDPKLINNLSVGEYHRHDLKFRYYGKEYDLTKASHGYTNQILTYPTELFKYAKVKGQNQLLLSVANLSDKQVSHKGFFSPKDDGAEHDILQINLYHILRRLEPEMQIKDFHAVFSEPEDFDDFLTTTMIPIINRILSNELRKIETTLEHELAHLIQYNFIQHPEQLKKNSNYGNAGDAGYWSSPVEFSPQLISAARNFENFIKDVIDDAPEDFKRYWFKHLTATKTAEDEVLFRSKYRGQYRPEALGILDNSPTFFTVLRQREPKLHRKAVKILYNELKKKSVME